MAMMPITAAPSKDHRVAGFTLIELLVVLTIMSLLAAIAVQAMEHRSDAFSRDKAALALKAAITEARGAALRSGSPGTVQLKTLAVSDLDVQPPIGVATDRLIIFPDGSSTGGVIRRGGHPLIAVDWLTSEVRDAR